jgi:FHS family L-fucose permease-like MFS transporter
MEKSNQNYKIGMTAFAAIFFTFGFATTFIITLSAKVKDIFTLSEFQAQLLTSAFFITYLVLSIPSGQIIKKIGYKSAVVLGLVLMAIGSFLFYPAAGAPSFPLFLTATFVLASGVVFLQTAANPYVSALGSEETASGRLNMVQALNSIATMIAPWLISVFIFKGTAEMLDAVQKAETVKMPFVIMGVIVILIALAILVLKLPALGDVEETTEKKSVWTRPHVLLGALGIFFYVGAEVGNAGLLVNYLENTIGITKEQASTYAAIYWGGAMVGRFFGTIMFSEIGSNTKKYGYSAIVLLLAFVSGAFVTDWNWNIGAIFTGIAFVSFLFMHIGRGKAAQTLAVFALIAAALDLLTTFTTGSVALWTIISIGLFNSIMFPNIFTLSIRNLDKGELSSASGIINSLVFGGAIIPLLMGGIADGSGYTWAFIVPTVCYLYIFFFATKGCTIGIKK